MIDPKKQYRTRQGLPVRIYAVDGDDEMPIHGAVLTAHGWKVNSWQRSGKWLDGGNDGADLIEVKPLIKRKVWVNVYDAEHPISWAFSSKGSANEHAASVGRIACVEIDIDVEEGHGL